MANPQPTDAQCIGEGERYKLKADPENGTTPVANLLLEALAMAHLSGEEKGAVLFLWRRTYGWSDGNQRKINDEISLREWAAALNTRREYASRVLDSLDRKNIILRTDLGKGKSYLYSMNTRVVEWDKGCLNTQQLSEWYKQGLSKKIRVPLSKKTTPADTKLASPKESIKERLNKDTTTIEDTTNSKLLEELQGLPNWRADESDTQWLTEFLEEFTLTDGHIKGCRDRNSCKPGKPDKGIWKNRLRNWMKQEHTPRSNNKKRLRQTSGQGFEEHTTAELAEAWQR